MSAETEVLCMDQVLRDEATFIQNVSQYFNQESLSDVVLKVGDQKFFGHRFILAKSSDVFRTMLYDKAWKGNNERDLKETPECEVVFDKFMKYLYTAEVCISPPTAVGILCLADKYNVGSLKELCISYMIENSRSPRVVNALNWYPWAKALNLESLFKQCAKTIAWNCQDIILSPDWCNMDIDFISDLLQNPELVVNNENSLLAAVQVWLLNERNVENLTENAKVLLPLLRFPQLQVAQLFTMEQSELYTRPECRDLLYNLVSQAYRFRALCPSQAQLGISFSESCYCPRDYVDLTVDNVRMQNTLRFGIQVDVKTFRGPVPTEVREADWKITYRKQNEIWSLQLYCHETALVNSEARIQASVLLYNEQEKVIQVQREQTCVCTRGNNININISVDQPEMIKNMAVLIKPVPA